MHPNNETEERDKGKRLNQTLFLKFPKDWYQFWSFNDIIHLARNWKHI